MARDAYLPVKPSRSRFHTIRGLRYHVREWGDAGEPLLVLLHGWMDVSASFQFLVDRLRHDWHAIAPDWRGFGLTERAREGYWFQDYYADLDALLEVYAPAAAVNLVGHSMGGNVACTYAGIRPQRVARLVSLEGFGSERTAPAMAPARYERWLAELRDPPPLRPYPSFEAVTARLIKNNPRLTAPQARFLAQHWGQRLDSGEVALRFDPRHKIVNPVLNRVEELLACWRRIACPVLWVRGRESTAPNWRKDTPEQLAERKAAFGDFREIVLENCGHMMHHDAPAELARLVEDFLRSRTDQP